MKSRIFSVFIGIGSALIIEEGVRMGIFIMDMFSEISEQSNTLMINVLLLSFLLSAGLVGIYPIYLWRTGKKTDAIVVVASTIITGLISLGYLLYMVHRIFGSID